MGFRISSHLCVSAAFLRGNLLSVNKIAVQAGAKGAADLAGSPPAGGFFGIVGHFEVAPASSRLRRPPRWRRYKIPQPTMTHYGFFLIGHVSYATVGNLSSI